MYDDDLGMCTVPCPDCGWVICKYSDGAGSCSQAPETHVPECPPGRDDMEGVCRIRRPGNADGIKPSPGDPICEATCPCCGASLRIEHGDDPEEISVIGEKR